MVKWTVILILMVLLSVAQGYLWSFWDSPFYIVASFVVGAIIGCTGIALGVWIDEGN